MEPGRFDDVEFRIVEEPADPQVPRRPRRIAPAVIASVAAVSLMGSLAAGASALTSTAQAPTRAAQQSHVAKQGHRWGKRDGICRKGEGHRRSAAALSY